MKRIFLTLALSIQFVCLTAQTHTPQRISIFADHIAAIAKQQHITYAEAAQKVFDLGYNGADVWVSIDSTQLAILDRTGFAHACAIAYIDFAQGEKTQETEQALRFMHRNHYTRLLLVPGLMPEGAGEQLAQLVRQRTEQFASQGLKAGFQIMIEDYDNPRSLCYNTPALDRLFAAAPSLHHVFDTGNYLFCGEEVMPALQHFRPLIGHVHLKDRKATHDSSSPAVGTGIVPMRDVIVSLLSTGYQGWFTVEHFGAPDMFGYARQSISTVQAAYRAYSGQDR